MEVYLEVTYFMNMILVLLSFEILCFLLNTQIKKMKLCQYVLTYNISILFLFVDFFDGFLLLYNLLITFFYFRRLTYIYYPIYMFVYISLLSFLEFILPQSTIFQGVLLIEGINGISLLIVSLLAIVIIYFYISFCHYKINKDQFVDIMIGKKHCFGFVDTGNKVFYKGYPVIFVANDLLDDYPVIDTINIATATCKETIEVVLIDHIEINHQALQHIYAGKLLTGEYDCILNSELMGGLL